MKRDPRQHGLTSGHHHALGLALRVRLVSPLCIAPPESGPRCAGPTQRL
jgi:hypothetical protein